MRRLYGQLDDRHRNPNINIRKIIWLGNQLYFDKGGDHHDGDGNDCDDDGGEAGMRTCFGSEVSGYRRSGVAPDR